MIVALMLLGTACLPAQKSYELNANKDHTLETTFDCFTVLIPGAKIGNQYKEVYFGNGECQGSSKALGKMSAQSKVVIFRDGERFDSPLTVSGNNITADLGGESVLVAQLSPVEHQFLLERHE